MLTDKQVKEFIEEIQKIVIETKENADKIKKHCEELSRQADKNMKELNSLLAII